MRHGYPLTLITALLTGAVTACQSAQPATPFASARQDCRSAETLLRPSPTGTPSMSPPLWRVRACPERAGLLLAKLLDTTRQVSDTAEVQRRTWLTQYVHDARITGMAMDVSTDAGATVPARLAAVRALIWSKSPGHMLPMVVMYARPSCLPSFCSSTYEGHFYGPGMIPTSPPTPWPVFGAPMRPGYAARIDSVLRQLLLAEATPPAVRGAAEWALVYPPSQRLGGR